MRRKSSGNNKKVIALDFFCGCGAVTHGMKKAGISVVAGFDNNSDVEFAYNNNNKGSKFCRTDVTNTNETIKNVKSVLSNVEWDILIFAACAPCQPFSMHARSNTYDSRRILLNNFIEIIARLPCKLQPSFIFCENVSSMRNKGEDVLKKALHKLEELKYRYLRPEIINAADFGVPQNRKRLFFVAAKSKFSKSKKFSWDYFHNNYKSMPKTVWDAIGNGRLPQISAGVKVNNKDHLHVTRALSEINLRRIRQITHPGGSRDMWDPKDNLRCYKRHKGHKDVYGRMSWDKPSPTLTCRCISLSNGRFGHPEQDRAISLREAAILQTMDGYRFKEPVLLNKVAEQIGNAVPPKLAEKFGNFILEIIREK